MKFTPQFLEQLRASILLSEVLGKRLALRRHGREFQALCPFHKEKTPSFTLNDEKGFYHCFGCGAHGDAINFIKEYDGVSFAEAVEKLAGEAGVAVPVPTREAQEQARKQATLYDVLTEAGRWFEQQLTQPAGRHAAQYLQQRGIRPETIATFGIGFAPNVRNGLKQAMLAKGITEKQLIDTGMIIVPDEGATYDRFRERVMFPIRDVAGRIIAFGGRHLPAAGAPEAHIAKYINSPETELFKKGEVLYNLPIARKAAHSVGALVIAEGYMDVIAMWQAGIYHAVAPLGTAFTSSHLERAWKLAPEPIMCLDGDNAGSRAMMRAADMAVPLLRPGLSLRFATLPKGEDPDSLIRGHGKEALERCLLLARNLSDILWDGAVAAIGRDTPEKQAALERSLIQLTEKISDKTVSSHYRSYFRKKLWPDAKDRKQTAPVTNLMATTAALGESGPAHTLHRLEQQLVKLVLTCPAILLQSTVEEEFARLEFVQDENDRLRAAILEQFGLEAVLTPAELVLALERKGQQALVENLLKNKYIQLPPGLLTEEDPTPIAMDVWQRVHAAYTLARMQIEYRQAVTQMGTEITEASFHKIIELKRQYESTERAKMRELAEQAD